MFLLSENLTMESNCETWNPTSYIYILYYIYMYVCIYLSNIKSLYNTIWVHWRSNPFPKTHPPSFKKDFTIRQFIQFHLFLKCDYPSIKSIIRNIISSVFILSYSYVGLIHMTYIIHMYLHFRGRITRITTRRNLSPSKCAKEVFKRVGIVKRITIKCAVT